jgi:SNF2 family DNA or RNA helicase
MDETWVPDDQKQLVDRIIDPEAYRDMGIYYYRSRDTIEEYIMGVTGEKEAVNVDILDLRRQGFRATHKK